MRHLNFSFCCCIRWKKTFDLLQQGAIKNYDKKTKLGVKRKAFKGLLGILRCVFLLNTILLRIDCCYEFFKQIKGLKKTVFCDISMYLI